VEVNVVPWEAGDGPESGAGEGGEGVQGEIVDGAEEEVGDGLCEVSMVCLADTGELPTYTDQNEEGYQRQHAWHQDWSLCL
jgi:hypothetical protein